jgi:hypothetical protein
MSNLVEKVKAKVENVLHKDNNTSSTTTNTHHHTQGTTGNYPVGAGAPISSGPTAGTTTGAGYGNQSTGLNSTGNGYGSTNAGPHDSNIANKLDPRVDSDRDGSHNLGGTGAGAGYGNQSTGMGSTGNGYGSTNAGPHDSNIANKLDPRVDSDRDGSRNMGASSYGPGGIANESNTTGNYTPAGVGSGNGYGSSNTGALGNQQSGYPQTTTAGPHSSNLANKLDPRVDSDNDGSRNAGMAQTGQGATYNASTGPASQTAGHHGSNLLNKLDPRVDSDASNNQVHGGVAAHDSHGHHGHHHNANPNTTF